MQPNNTSREVLLALRECVLAAKGADREVDAHVICALLAPAGSWVEISPIYCVVRVCTGLNYRGAAERWAAWPFWAEQRVTSSIDAALALAQVILPKWSLRIGLSEGYRHPGAVMGRSYPTNKQAAAEHQSAPLAIIQCALDALIIEAEEAALAGGQTHG